MIQYIFVPVIIPRSFFYSPRARPHIVKFSSMPPSLPPPPLHFATNEAHPNTKSALDPSGFCLQCGKVKSARGGTAKKKKITLSAARADPKQGCCDAMQSCAKIRGEEEEEAKKKGGEHKKASDNNTPPPQLLPFLLLRTYAAPRKKSEETDAGPTPKKNRRRERGERMGD